MIIETQQPSNEIMKFFENKLKYHIYNVNKDIYKVIHNNYLSINDNKLLALTCKNHDKDRFELFQFIPQALYYEYKLKNIPIDKKLKKIIFLSLKKHKQTNTHHPEYFNDINNMSIINIIEFICDIKDIHKKKPTNIYDIITTNYKFNENNLKIIKEVLNIIT